MVQKEKDTALDFEEYEDILSQMIWLDDTSKGDSRTSGGKPSMDEVYDATVTHIDDVYRVLLFVCSLLECRGKLHDWTKLENFNEEYGFLVCNDIQDEEFLNSSWWMKHIREERHHLNDYSRLDVDLIDVLEMIIDRVCAEKGRTGEINTNYLQIDKDLLYRAYWNTITLIDNHTLQKKYKG